MIRWLYLMILSAAWVLPLPAQHFTFKDYSEAQGLANLNVRCLLQDQTGFLWVGTEGGVFRYDGTRFEGFTSKDGAPVNLINSIAQDGSGTVWVGTGKGLTYFDGQAFHAVQYEGQDMQLSVQSLAMLPDGRLLAASKGLLLSVERTRESSHGNAKHNIKGAVQEDWTVKPWPAKSTQEARALRQVSMFRVRKDGLILFVCGPDLCQSSPSSFRRYSAADGVPSDRYHHLFFDREGQSWALGIRHLLKLPRGANHFLDAAPPQAGGLVQTVDEDAQGRVLATSTGTVSRWADGKWETFTSSNGIPDLPITALFKDREGSLWLAPPGHGLKKWLGYGTAEGWTRSEGLPSNVISSILRDNSGRLWVGAYDGLAMQSADRRRFLPVPLPPSMKGDPIVALAETRDGFLWVSSFRGHLAAIKTQSRESARAADSAPRLVREVSLPAQAVFRLFDDSHDNLWIGTLEGLFVSEGTAMDRHFHRLSDPALGSEGVSDIAENSSGLLFARARNDVLVHTGSAWRHLNVNVPGYLLSFGYADLAIAPDGSIWTNGSDPGLLRLELQSATPGTANLKRAAILSGMPAHSGPVSSILRDQQNRMWVGHAGGVDLFDGSGWKSFTKDDGLIWNDSLNKALWADAGRRRMDRNFRRLGALAAHRSR